MGSYSDSRYGIRRRVIGPLLDPATAEDNGCFSFPVKTKIFKFGMIPVKDCTLATATTLTLQTYEGTDLATFTPVSGSDPQGTGSATGKTITATTVSAGNNLNVAIATAGSSGSFRAYIDIEDQYDASAEDASV